MPLHIVVTAKQVMDPETPASALRVDQAAKKIVPPQNIAPVINGFDENAIEAALRIKDKLKDAKVTVISMGKAFTMDVMKKALSMGADEMVLLQDDAFENTPDSFATGKVLAAGIKKLGQVDLIISGRQASDWDNAQTPFIIADALGWPIVTLGRSVDVQNDKLVVERVIPDGSETVEAPLPCVVTVSNELGQPRYPTLRGIMAAGRKKPTIYTASDLDASGVGSQLDLLDLFVPTVKRQVELIDGENDADKGRKLALRLREEKLI